MSAELAALFPDSFEDSPLGKVPRGWGVGTVGDVVSFLSGFAFKSKDWTNEGVPVIKIGSVKPGVVDLSQVSYVSTEIAKQAARYQLQQADLLIGMTGYVGEVGLVPPTDNPPLLNQRVGKLVLPSEGTRELAYVYCLTRDPEFKSSVEQKAHGTAQANVSASSILSINAMIPPSLVQSRFNLLCQPLFDRLLSNLAETRTLAALRDALLPKLLSGAVAVGDAEGIITQEDL
jgi:type I restriction enzyme S subunit